MDSTQVKSRFILYRTGLLISFTVFGFTTPSCAKDTSYAPVSITKSFSEVMKEDTKNKSALMNKHNKLLNKRYNLSEKVDSTATMSGGKPLPVGPTVNLQKG